MNVYNLKMIFGQRISDVQMTELNTQGLFRLAEWIPRRGK